MAHEEAGSTGGFTAGPTTGLTGDNGLSRQEAEMTTYFGQTTLSNSRVNEWWVARGHK